MLARRGTKARRDGLDEWAPQERKVPAAPGPPRVPCERGLGEGRRWGGILEESTAVRVSGMKRGAERALEAGLLRSHPAGAWKLGTSWEGRIRRWFLPRDPAPPLPSLVCTRGRFVIAPPASALMRVCTQLPGA